MFAMFGEAYKRIYTKCMISVVAAMFISALIPRTVLPPIANIGYIQN